MNSILKNRYSGWFKSTICSINPDKDELEALMGEEVQDTPEYTYVKRDGTKCTRIDVYLQDIKTNTLFKDSIFIEDKDEEFKSGVKRYINQSGKFQITDSEDNLFNNFTNFTEQVWEKGKLVSETKLGERKYRVAKIGEYDLMHLYIMARDSFNKNGDYFLDINKILEGDLSQLDIRFNEPLFSAYAYVDNTEDYKQKVFKTFMKLIDFQSLVTGESNKYNSGTIKTWEKNWNFLKDDKIHREGRLDNITEDDIPLEKDLSDEDSDY